VAWEDRTRAQRAEARRAAKAYEASDDGATYEVMTPKGTRLTVTGINSARVVAGKGGTIRKVAE
jgi:hypothetical protein